MSGGDTLSDTPRPGLRVADVVPVILAGGFGTRLQSVVADRPKVIAEVCGRPFLTLVLERLGQAGFRKVTICTGYQSEQIEKLIGSSYHGLAVSYAREDFPLGTGGALRGAIETFSEEHLLALNGDSFLELSFPALLGFFSLHRPDVVLAAAEVDDVRRYGRLGFDRTLRISSFEEKGGRSERGWINAGVYLLRRSLLEPLEPQRQISLERELLPFWANTHTLLAYPVRNRFIDIGTPESFAEAQVLFGAAAG